MKKLAIVSVMVLALASFACSDDDSKNGSGKNNGAGNNNTPQVVDQQKINSLIDSDKAYLKRVIACTEEENYTISADDLQGMNERVSTPNDDDSWNPYRIKPYSRCMDELIADLKCRTDKLSCKVILDGYFERESDIDLGECASSANVTGDCMERNEPTAVASLCERRYYCEMGEAYSLNEIEKCELEDEQLGDGACRNAKLAYFDCSDSFYKTYTDEYGVEHKQYVEFCDVVRENGCADEKAAEDAACGSKQ